MSNHIYTVQKRQPLGDWELVEVTEMTFEEAARIGHAQLVEHGGDAVEARFAELWKSNWIYIPQWIDSRPEPTVEWY